MLKKRMAKIVITWRARLFFCARVQQRARSSFVSRGVVLNTAIQVSVRASAIILFEICSRYKVKIHLNLLDN